MLQLPRFHLLVAGSESEPASKSESKRQLFDVESEKHEDMWLDGGASSGKEAALTSQQDLTDHMQKLFREDREAAARRVRKHADIEHPARRLTKNMHIGDVSDDNMLQGTAIDDAIECTFKPLINDFEFSRPRGDFLDEMQKDAQKRQVRGICFQPTAS